MVILKMTKITISLQIEEMLWLITLLCHMIASKTVKILKFTDIICKYNIQSLITLYSKPPDHSVVCVDIFSGHKQFTSHSDKSLSLKSKVYDFSHIPDGFMANDTWQQNIKNVINKLENIQGEQLEVNEVLYKWLFSRGINFRYIRE